MGQTVDAIRWRGHIAHHLLAADLLTHLAMRAAGGAPIPTSEDPGWARDLAHGDTPGSVAAWIAHITDHLVETASLIGAQVLVGWASVHAYVGPLGDTTLSRVVTIDRGAGQVRALISVRRGFDVTTREHFGGPVLRDAARMLNGEPVELVEATA